MTTTKTSLLALTAAILSLSAPAQATDILTDPSTAYVQDNTAAPHSWTGPWVAALAGYSIATLTTETSEPFGLSIEGGFAQGELGFDQQFGSRFVMGGYLCAAYSAIEGLADGYCVQARGGVLLTPDTLLFGNVGWRWQGTDGEGDDSIYFSGPAAGIGIESRATESAAIKLSYEHHWITDVDGNDVPDGLDLNDNRVMTGVVFRH